MNRTYTAVSRSLAVTLGAYAMTSLVTVALSLLLTSIGINKVEAVTAATLSSFAIFAIAAMAAFHAHSPARAWGGLALIGVVACALVLLLSGSVS